MAIGDLLDNAIGFVENNPIKTAVGVGAAAVGTGLVVAAVRGSNKKRKSRKSKSSRKRNSMRRTRKRRQKQPYTAGKRKDRSHKRIRYTKNNQPYIIKANGRAQFISKKSVRLSRKRKGGRY